MDLEMMKPVALDGDGDGLKDILVNSIWGKVEWYKNIC
jgi:hypothetical protein